MLQYSSAAFSRTESPRLKGALGFLSGIHTHTLRACRNSDSLSASKLRYHGTVSLSHSLSFQVKAIIDC